MSKNLWLGCLEIFRESFEGVAPGHRYTWYVEGKEAIFDAIDSITPEQASHLFPGSRATIGAHANHLFYYLHLFNVGNRGEKEKSDWEGSWTVQTFDTESWQDVRNRTRAEFNEAFAWYQAQAEKGEDLKDEEKGTSVISNIAHAAYHLGAIRAMIPMLSSV